MALSFVQKPISDSATVPVITNYTPLVPYVVYRDASLGSVYYYHLILEVYLGASITPGAMIAKIKQKRNNYVTDVVANLARAVFDVREIVKTRILSTVLDQNTSAYPQSPIWRIGEADTDKIISTNLGTVQEITVRAIEFYSGSAADEPAEITSDAINDGKYYINASADLTFPRDTTTSGLQPDGADAVLAPYQLDGSTKRFLSDLPLDTVEADYMGYNFNLEGGLKYINYVTPYHWQSLGFMNGVDRFGSNARGFIVEYYNGVTAGTKYYFRNESANGGQDPVTGATIDKRELILFIGCGPKNLEEQSVVTSMRPSNQFSGAWTHYRIFAVSETFYNPSGNTPVSANYWFIRGCSKYFGGELERQAYRNKPVRLTWLNSLGCWDTYTFEGKSTESVDIDRNENEKLIGNFSDSVYSYGDYERQKSTSTVTSKVKIKISTKYVSERLTPFIEGLIKSKEVYVHSDEDYGVTGMDWDGIRQGVVVTQSSFIRKTSVNDKIIQYSINLEYANNFNNNSQ